MRTAEVTRKTKETDIICKINLDGSGDAKIETGIGFFDHMLTAFAKHGFFDLELSCKGDLSVDTHHTVEDCGIVLGTAFSKALSDKNGIKRYGSFTLPMDDALIVCAVDLCGRPYLNFDMNLVAERVGDFETETAREFFYAFSYSAAVNLHIKELAGINTHHKLEAAFKAFTKALAEAVSYDSRVKGVLSTKGSI